MSTENSSKEKNGLKVNLDHQFAADADEMMVKKISQEPLINFLKKVIHFTIRVTAVMITLVIIWAVIDVGWEIYRSLTTAPIGLLNKDDLLPIFGAFMVVLIAIEIFVNIIMYLQDQVIHVKIVLATALMAIARKVIIFDFDKVSYHYIWATSLVIISLGFTYWLVSKHYKGRTKSTHLMDGNF